MLPLGEAFLRGKVPSLEGCNPLPMQKKSRSVGLIAHTLVCVLSNRGSDAPSVTEGKSKGA